MMNFADLSKEFSLCPIRNEETYDTACELLYDLQQIEDRNPDEELYFQMLALIIEDYESGVEVEEELEYV